MTFDVFPVKKKITFKLSRAVVRPVFSRHALFSLNPAERAEIVLGLFAKIKV